MKSSLCRLGGITAAVALALGAATFPGKTARTERFTGLKHAPIQVHRHSDGTLKRGPLNQMVSGNWSGYVVAHYQTGQTYLSAQGTWIVPSVSYFPGFSEEYSASWVGIGGFCKNALCFTADHTLIQLGTSQNVSSSGTGYSAWYEMIPNPPVQIKISVSPGDIITASLECMAACSSSKQSWKLTMTNVTQNVSWSGTFKYASSRLSAEWIEEAPSSAGGVLPLANYGPYPNPAPFDPGSPSLSSSDGIVMEDPWGQTSNPSAPDSDTDGFSTCWGSGTSLTPCYPPNS